jgi:hypothetical protein
LIVGKLLRVDKGDRQWFETTVAKDIGGLCGEHKKSCKKSSCQGRKILRGWGLEWEKILWNIWSTLP